jgi:hypothetical protein
MQDLRYDIGEGSFKVTALENDIRLSNENTRQDSYVMSIHIDMNDVLSDRRHTFSSEQFKQLDKIEDKQGLYASIKPVCQKLGWIGQRER